MLASATVTLAHADVLILVDKSRQQMSVSVDGVPRYRWVVSTGRAGYGTPSGTYHPIRLEREWFSKEYYNSPMPHAIFFHGGYAIHGSYEISHLGGPASHGCIRLHPADAAKLFALVKDEGIGKTTIVVTGQNPPIVAQRRSRPRFAQEEEETAAVRGDTGYGQPMQISPYGPPRYAPSYGYEVRPAYPYGQRSYEQAPPRGLFPFFNSF